MLHYTAPKFSLVFIHFVFVMRGWCKFGICSQCKYKQP